MRVSARKGCKEHLERSESASYNNNIYNIIYIIYNIYNTYTHSSMYGGFATPEAFRSHTLAAPSGLPQNNSKKKGEDFYLPLFIIYINMYVTTWAARPSSMVTMIRVLSMR